MILFDTTRPLPYLRRSVFEPASHGGPASSRRTLGIPARNVICTGDIVAYCAAPEEAAQFIAAWDCHVIQGNCEQQLAVAAEDCACNFEEGTECAALAKGWYPFANAMISSEMRTWMAQLPETLYFSYAGRGFRVVHGGTAIINRWVFQSERDVLTEEVTFSGANITIAGHSGLPYIARIGRRVWFNPGVIGTPANDGTADVWYGLVHALDSGLVLSTHRLAYDHNAADAAMRRSGHANGYARTLITGLWPSLDILPPAEREATGKRLRQRTMRLAVQVTSMPETTVMS